MAEIPLFYHPERLSPGAISTLSEDSAKHIGQVLRMTAGEEIQLTDGLGMLADCVLSKVEKKRVEVSVTTVLHIARQVPSLRVAVAFTRNASRNEWLLEKAAELGIHRITPLIAERSVRERTRHERWMGILTSAMLQSKQAWRPILDAAATIPAVLAERGNNHMFIAHCMDDVGGRQPITQVLIKGQNTVIMIGPEGDFTPAELTLAEAAGATSISLGPNRLRTETAALAAITHFYLLNHASTD